MRQDLLPPNSTALEIHLATACAAILQLGDEKIIGCKFDPTYDYVAPLIAEYSLGELLPYFTDTRKLLREGIAWARIRGTPQSLLTAMDWCGLQARLEEEVVGVHFAEYQLHVDDHLSAEKLCTIVELAQLAQPVRSHLARIVGSYDVRRLMLSGGVNAGALDDQLLSADSGVRPTSAQMPCLPWQTDFMPPLLSFGQQHGYSLSLWTAPQSLILQSAYYLQYGLKSSHQHAHFPVLDDLPQPWEIASVQSHGGHIRASVPYVGQVWTKVAWTEDTWQTVRTVIDHAMSSHQQGAQQRYPRGILPYRDQIWCASNWTSADTWHTSTTIITGDHHADTHP